MNRLFATPVLALTLLAFVSCSSPAEPRSEFVLGTVCTVNLFEKGTNSVYTEIFLRLHQLEDILSANRDDTNVAEINRYGGIRPVEAAPETLAILKEGLRFATLSGGLLDPTVGPLVKAWNIGSEYAAVPSEEALAKARALVDYRKVSIDETTGTVYLPKEGMKLDLGAIAKGFAADEVARIAARHGITKGMVDLGGNILAIGSKASKQPWKIGIRNPENDAGGSVLALQIENQAVVTSGVYERYFVENGKHYHHILNPFSGYPEENGLLSVSIVTSRSIDADALSTAVFLLGLERGMALVESLDGVEAIFIDASKRIHLSPGLEGKVTILNDEFSLLR